MNVVSSHVTEAVVSPLQEKMDDWRKTATTLDKEHAKGNFTFLLPQSGIEIPSNALSNITYDSTVQWKCAFYCCCYCYHK